jgi:hypothetical protein
MGIIRGVDKNIIISVGPHKTGSTFLEVEIFPSYSNIVDIWKDRSDVFVDMLKINTSKKTSIVNEGLCGHYLFEYKGRRDIVKRLKVLFPNALIVLSYREHLKYITSMYAGYVVAGGSLKIDEFFNFNSGSFLKSKYISFKDIYLDFKKHFDDIFVFNIDDISNNKKKFIKNFSNFLEESAPDIETIKWTPVNKSSPPFLLNIQRMINTVIEPKYKNLKSKRDYLNLPLRKVFFVRTSVYHHFINLLKTLPIKGGNMFKKNMINDIELHFKKDLDYMKKVDSVL